MHAYEKWDNVPSGDFIFTAASINDSLPQYKKDGRSSCRGNMSFSQTFQALNISCSRVFILCAYTNSKYTEEEDKCDF